MCLKDPVVSLIWINLKQSNEAEVGVHFVNREPVLELMLELRSDYLK